MRGKIVVIVGLVALACGLVAGTGVADDLNQTTLAPPSNLLAGPLSSSGTTYLVDADNENNAGTGVADGDMGAASTGCLYKTSGLHPIEFNIMVTGPVPATSALLLLEVWDVDRSSGEIDEVYFNNTKIGELTGANGQWSNPSFAVPLALVVAGKNTVRVMVDTGTSGNWCTWVARAQLVIDGGAAATAICRGITLNGTNLPPSSSLVATVEADTTLASQSLYVEVNVYNPSNQIILGENRTFTVTGTQDEPQAFTFALPSGPIGQYRVDALIFDSTTRQLQTMCSKQFELGKPDPIPALGTLGLAGLVVLLALAGAFALLKGRILS